MMNLTKHEAEAYIKSLLSELPEEEYKLVIDILTEKKHHKDELLRQVYDQVYEKRFPPLDEFLYSKEYLSLPKRVLYPAVEELLWAIDSPKINEAFIQAGKGSGKSSLTSITMARQTYRLRCFVDPAAYFNFLPDELLAVVNMSISAPQAANVMFKKYWALLKNAPCFYDLNNVDYEGNPKPLFKKTKQLIYFPCKELYALSGHSGYQVFFGYNVFFGCADELSWFKDTEDHEISKEVWEGMKAAATTRFILNDVHYYKLVGISSPQHDEDFLVSTVTETSTLGKEYVLGYVDGDKDAGVINIGSWKDEKSD